MDLCVSEWRRFEVRVHPDRLDRPAKGSTTGWIAGLALAVVAVVVGIERHGDCEVVPCLRIGGLRLLAGWRTRLRKGIQNKRMELSSQYDRRFNYELRWTSTGLRLDFVMVTTGTLLVVGSKFHRSFKN